MKGEQPTQPIALETAHLSRAVVGKVLTDDINLQIQIGEVVAVVGPSGSGKSSFLRLLNRLDEQSGREFLSRSSAAGFSSATGDPVAAKQMALQSLVNLREQQSSALSYFDIFFIFCCGCRRPYCFCFLHETLRRWKRRSPRGRMKGSIYAA